MKSFLAAMLVVAFGAPAVLRADPIINSPTGLVAPGTAITFSEVVLPDGMFLTNEYAAFGLTFGNAFYNTPPAPPPPSPNIDSPHVVNFGPAGQLFTPLSLFFDEPQTSAAFALVSNPGTTTFQAVLAGSVVEAFSAATNFANPNNYFGFTAIAFDEIRVIGPITNRVVAIDNVQFGQATQVIDEPGSMALLALGVAGLLAWRWRRRRRMGAHA